MAVGFITIVIILISGISGSAVVGDVPPLAPALLEAKNEILRAGGEAQWSSVVDRLEPLCGHGLLQQQEQDPAAAAVSILDVACLNLLGLSLYMIEDSRAGPPETSGDGGQGEGRKRSKAAFLQAYQLVHDRHASSSLSPYDLVELELMKNLQWCLQAGDEEGPMLAVREALTRSIVQSNGLLPIDPPAYNLSASFYDLGLAAKVCGGHSRRHHAGSGDGRDLYVDMVKRGVSYFLHSDMPHPLMPAGPRWDIYYRMRDFQTSPPRNGQRFEDGFTTKEVGVLDLIEEAAMSVMRDGVEGDWMEAGVWRGGTSILLAAIAKAYRVDDEAGGGGGRRVILADSFSGIPSSSLVEWEERYAVTRATVEENFRRFGLLEDDDDHHQREGGTTTTTTTTTEGAPNKDEKASSSSPVVFVEGFFSTSLPHFIATTSPSPLRLSLLLADADAYQSTVDILHHLYPSLSVGGYVIVDDFHIPECRQAVMHYRHARGIREPMLPVPTDYAYGVCLQSPSAAASSLLAVAMAMTLYSCACRTICVMLLCHHFTITRCLAKGADGSRLPSAEEGGLVASWPHAMYWRRSMTEAHLRPYIPPPPSEEGGGTGAPALTSGGVDGAESAGAMML